MDDQNYTTSFTVAASPGAAVEAIADVARWWSPDIEGSTKRPGDEFVYRYRDLHTSRQRLVELAPGNRVVWEVTDADLTFLENRDEWVGTTLVFDVVGGEAGTVVTFTHRGITPLSECFEACSGGWDHFINTSLRELITTGVGKPDLPSSH